MAFSFFCTAVCLQYHAGETGSQEISFEKPVKTQKKEQNRKYVRKFSENPLHFPKGFSIIDSVKNRGPVCFFGEKRGIIDGS